MESNACDRIIGRLGTDASRRRMLGGLVGAVTAALAGGTALEAKPKHRRRSNGSNGGGAGADKVAICHFTGDRQRGRRLRVGRRALKAHLARGDTPFVDCCVNEDCEVPACFSAQCVAGTCSQTQLPQGTPCTLDWPAGGLASCTAGGLCVPTAAGGSGGE